MQHESKLIYSIVINKAELKLGFGDVIIYKAKINLFLYIQPTYWRDSYQKQKTDFIPRKPITKSLYLQLVNSFSRKEMRQLGILFVSYSSNCYQDEHLIEYWVDETREGYTNALTFENVAQMSNNTIDSNF